MKISYVFLIILFLFVGCSNPEEMDEIGTDNDQITHNDDALSDDPELDEPSNEDSDRIVLNEDEGSNEELEEVESENNLEVDANTPLENIGEFTNSEIGRVELYDIARPTETYVLIDDLNLKFNDIKILYHSEIPNSEKDIFRDIYGFSEDGYTVQLSYSIENNKDEKVEGIEVEDIVTSNGNQYNLYSNGTPLSGSSYDVRPNAKVNNVAVAINIEDPDIRGLTLYFNLFVGEEYHMEETSLEIEF